MKGIKVKDYPDLLRDPRSGALINYNSDIYHAAMARKRKKLKERSEVNELKKEIEELKTLIGELKNK